MHILLISPIIFLNILISRFLLAFLFVYFRFILAMRSQEFKQMFANSSSTEEVKIHLDVSTEALETLVKYLYTDSVAHEDITEDLVALSEKYNLTQVRIPFIFLNFFLIYIFVKLIGI